MKDVWACGFVNTGHSPAVDAVDGRGTRLKFEASKLWEFGIPLKGRTRLVYSGDASEWTRLPAEEWPQEIGILAQEGQPNRHGIFLAHTGAGPVAIPALVLMRAMFQPTGRLLEQALKPQGLDAISYIDYEANPPRVVIDDPSYSGFIGSVYSGWRKGRTIEWLQLSRSARASTCSAQLWARRGAIDLTPPLGLAKFVFHGARCGDIFLATRASLISMSVSAADSLTGRAETFNFHPTAEKDAAPTVSLKGISVPMNHKGRFELTDAEWGQVEAMLEAPGRRCSLVHCPRTLLNGILYRLIHGGTWDQLPYDQKVRQSCAKAFRNWSISNRLRPVLNYLAHSRAAQALPAAA